MFTPLQRACSEPKSSVAELLIIVWSPASGFWTLNRALGWPMQYHMHHMEWFSGPQCLALPSGAPEWEPCPTQVIRLGASTSHLGPTRTSYLLFSFWSPSYQIDFEGLLSTVTNSTQKTFILCPSSGIFPPRISLRGPKHAVQSLSSRLFKQDLFPSSAVHQNSPNSDSASPIPTLLPQSS